MNPHRLINLARGAELAGISRRTLYSWIALGYVPSIVRGGTRFVRVSTLLDVAGRSRAGRFEARRQVPEDPHP